MTYRTVPMPHFDPYGKGRAAKEHLLRILVWTHGEAVAHMILAGKDALSELDRTAWRRFGQSVEGI